MNLALKLKIEIVKIIVGAIEISAQTRANDLTKELIYTINKDMFIVKGENGPHIQTKSY